MYDKGLDWVYTIYVYIEMSENSGTNGKNLQERITEACAALDPDMLKRIQRNMVHWLRKCMGVGGGHVEHILSKQ
jgi:hypothetical protein